MTFRKIQVFQHSTDFRQATKIVTKEIPTPSPGEILIKNHYVGINASDINHTSGKYKIGEEFPYDAGFESIGEVIQVGDTQKSRFKVGDKIGSTSFGAFSEFQIVKENFLLKIPEITSTIIPLLVSGLTASIALEQVGNLNFDLVNLNNNNANNNANKRKKTVLVTAAAGGTGIFAVQLAKLANYHVIGTVGSDSKIETLKQLGCDHVINYNKENLQQVLSKTYPKGIDLIYESVGGDIFDTCLRNLAVKGSLIVIGMISTYKEGIEGENSFVKFFPLQLLQKSAKIHGFFLNHFYDHWERHLLMLSRFIGEGLLKSVVDSQEFVGLEEVANAIDYLYSGRNIGKVVVKLLPSSSSSSNSSHHVQSRL